MDKKNIYFKIKSSGNKLYLFEIAFVTVFQKTNGIC